MSGASRGSLILNGPSDSVTLSVAKKKTVFDAPTLETAVACCQARREGGGRNCSPGAQRKPRIRASPPGLVFDLIFNLYLIIRVNNKVI